jgi:hypothetical protein
MTTPPKSPLDARRDELAKDLYGMYGDEEPNTNCFKAGWDAAMTELAKAPRDAREWTLHSDYDSSPIEASGPQFRGSVQAVEREALTQAQALLRECREIVDVDINDFETFKELKKHDKTVLCLKDKLDKFLEEKK